MEICARVYRPRRPKETPLYRLVSQHIEEFLRIYDERFARRHGPLRPVVERTLREFLTCGLPQHGFGRLWCKACRKSFIAPFSCRSRNLCPSCEKKRSLLWAEWLQQEVLEPVPHRHVVMTMPRLLRPTFRKRRELLLDLSQCGAETLAEYVRRLLERTSGRESWSPSRRLEISWSGIHTDTSSLPTAVSVKTAPSKTSTAGTARP